MQNPKYKGYYTGGLSTVVDYRSKKRNFNDRLEWKIYKDYEKVPPIVSEELWEKANSKLISRSKSSKMYQKHQTKYPLSGKLYCEKHKCSFVRKIRHYKNREDEIYWYCSDFHKTGKRTCILCYINEQDIYDILLSVFKTYEIYKKEIYEELFSFYNNNSKVEEIEKQNTKLQNELDVLNKRKNKMLDLVLDGFLNKEDFNLKKMSIEKQIDEVKLKLEQLKCRKVTEKEHKNNCEMLKANILKELEMTKDNLESYIEELLDKIIVIEKNNNNVELKIILVNNKIVSIG